MMNASFIEAGPFGCMRACAIVELLTNSTNSSYIPQIARTCTQSFIMCGPFRFHARARQAFASSSSVRKGHTRVEALRKGTKPNEIEWLTGGKRALAKSILCKCHRLTSAGHCNRSIDIKNFDLCPSIHYQYGTQTLAAASF